MIENSVRKNMDSRKNLETESVRLSDEAYQSKRISSLINEIAIDYGKKELNHGSKKDLEAYSKEKRELERLKEINKIDNKINNMVEKYEDSNKVVNKHKLYKNEENNFHNKREVDLNIQSDTLKEIMNDISSLIDK